MKVLITGSKGQLGQALIENKPENIDLILSSRDTFDLTSKKECDFYTRFTRRIENIATLYTPRQGA